MLQSVQIIESRHVLCGVLCPPQIEATAKYRRLYQSAIELLPIWIMFIDRIIDGIWFLVVILTTESLNPHQFEASCRGGRGMRLPLTAQNPAIKRCSPRRRPCINQR